MSGGAGDGKSADRILNKFGLRGRGRATPNIPSANRQSTSSSSSKRTFAPKIVERALKKEETSDPRQPSNKSKRGRPFGRGGGGGGRSRDGNIIQTASVFSHGLFAQPTLAKALCGGERYSGGGEGQPSAVTTTTKFEAEESLVESDKVEETMDEDGKLERDGMRTGDLHPVTLPLAAKVPPTLKREGVKKLKKEATGAESFEKKMVNKMNVAEGVDVKDNNNINNNIKDKTDSPQEPELKDLFSADRSDEEQLLFFQFPDTLPIKPISQDAEDLKAETKGGVDSKNKGMEQEMSDHLKRFTFQNVSEGLIGRLTVHKSGKVKMHLGNVSLDVSLGTPCGFLQDLVSVRTDREPAEMISLGHVAHRLIACPDYKALLGSVVDAS